MVIHVYPGDVSPFASCKDTLPRWTARGGGGGTDMDPESNHNNFIINNIWLTPVFDGSPTIFMHKLMVVYSESQILYICWTCLNVLTVYLLQVCCAALVGVLLVLRWWVVVDIVAVNGSMFRSFWTVVDSSGSMGPYALSLRADRPETPDQQPRA